MNTLKYLIVGLIVTVASQGFAATISLQGTGSRTSISPVGNTPTGAFVFTIDAKQGLNGKVTNNAGTGPGTMEQILYGCVNPNTHLYDASCAAGDNTNVLINKEEYRVDCLMADPSINTIWFSASSTSIPVNDPYFRNPPQFDKQYTQYEAAGHGISEGRLITSGAARLGAGMADSASYVFTGYDIPAPNPITTPGTIWTPGFLQAAANAVSGKLSSYNACYGGNAFAVSADYQVADTNGNTMWYLDGFNDTTLSSLTSGPDAKSQANPPTGVLYNISYVVLPLDNTSSVKLTITKQERL